MSFIRSFIRYLFCVCITKGSNFLGTQFCLICLRVKVRSLLQGRSRIWHWSKFKKLVSFIRYLFCVCIIKRSSFLETWFCLIYLRVRSLLQGRPRIWHWSKFKRLVSFIIYFILCLYYKTVKFSCDLILFDLLKSVLMFLSMFMDLTLREVQ